MAALMASLCIVGGALVFVLAVFYTAYFVIGVLVLAGAALIGLIWWKLYKMFRSRYRNQDLNL